MATISGFRVIFSKVFRRLAANGRGNGRLFMDIIDDEGRIFGVVNVVDALVILLAVGVVAAGVALVNPFGPEEAPASRFATVELGPQPTYVAEKVSPGDTMPLSGRSGNLTVTDVYRSPAVGGDVMVTVRVRLDGEMVLQERFDEEVFVFDGAQVRAGDELAIETIGYSVKGRVTSVDEAGPTLDAEWVPVVLRGTVPDGTGSVDIDGGDAFSSGGHEFLRVSRVEAYPAGDDVARVVIGGELLVLNEGGSQLFGGAVVTKGRELDMEINGRPFRGEVRILGSSSLPGESAKKNAEVKVAGVEPEVAGALKPGLVEEYGGEVLAEIEGSRAESATVTHVSDTGDVVMSTHPVKRDVFLNVTLSVRDNDRVVYFRGEPLRVGDTVALDFGTVSVRGTVVSLEG